MSQPDLFPQGYIDPYDTEAELYGWERAIVRDYLSKGPLTVCFQGFTGSICERLVVKGLATKEDAGEMPPKSPWEPDLHFKTEREYLRWFKQQGPMPRFTYALNEERAA